VGSERSRWERFTGFGAELSYPSTTPDGQTVERTEQRVSDHRGELERVHLSTPDRQELYFELARFADVTPQDEYSNHKPYLEQRFGTGSVSELTQTKLLDRRAWTYAFHWHEEGRRMERAALLLDVGGGTYRLIYDPRSELNAQVLETFRISD
jgi:hypothetical protein